MNILIIGYGNIGKHIYEEFKNLQPYIKDPLQSQMERYPCKNSTTCELECSAQKNETECGYFFDFAFICVPTDMLSDGSCDTSIVEQVVSETNAGVIVIKSTITPGTTKRLISATNKNIVFSPEHYGVTQHCKPDPGFVILGGGKEQTAKVAELYAKVKNGCYKFHFTDATTAELSKYMLNSFLALKVTFCSEFADLADKFGVSYPELRELFVADERVGASYTYVYPDKPYYDSHCFNKDIPALVQFSEGSTPLMSCVNNINSSKKPKQSGETDLTKISHREFGYDCSICLIIRDENEYLQEWLEWHLGQGVQHFYIYDHGSKNPVEQFVQSLSSEILDKVTVIDWGGSHNNAQPDAYNDCLQRFGNESKWIGFIDADEHVRVKTGQSLSEFLKDYEEYAGLFAVWVTYGASGQKHKSDLLLRERFQKISPRLNWANKAGKVLIQPRFMKDMLIHNGHPIQGFDIVGEWKDVVPEFQITKDDPTTDLICVDHYYTKSYEEWLEKLRRGRCHLQHARIYEEFFEYNPDMEHCREVVFPIQEYELSEKNINNKEINNLLKVSQVKLEFKYYCSICLLIRDENEYLKEWLEWHIGQGVQHFYIYDHASKNPVSEFIQALDKEIADKVTIINWSGMHENAQPDAYNNCLEKFSSESKWIGFIDADEQVRVKTGQSLPDFLTDYEEFAGVYVIWITYGADGQKHKSDLLLRERFKRSVSKSWSDKMGKIFVQPTLMKDMYIHNGHPIEGFDVVGEWKDVMPEFQMKKDNPTTDLICVDHYYTKSYEEWLEKLRRGTCNAQHSRKYNDFFIYNPNMEYCREEICPTQEYKIFYGNCNNMLDATKLIAKNMQKEMFYICAIVKDEHEYIQEWVLHNKNIGFDKIILYDNEGSKPYNEVLSDLMREGFIEIIPWHDDSYRRQINAYNDFIRSENWTGSDYCAFIDPDEFIFFDNVKTVSDFMKIYADYSGVGLSWRTYNADGRIDSPNGKIPTTEAYTTEFEYWEPRVKFIGRLADIEDVFSPHAFCPKNGHPPLITTGGEVIVNQDPHYKDYTNGHIKHYITKSWQDWVKRLKRGNITKGLRGVDTFFRFNPDMEHLRTELVKDLDYSEFPTIYKELEE